MRANANNVPRKTYSSRPIGRRDLGWPRRRWKVQFSSRDRNRIDEYFLVSHHLFRFGDTLISLNNFRYYKNLPLINQLPLFDHKTRELELLTNSMLMGPEGSMPHSPGLSNNPYPDPNQPNPSY